MTLNRFLIQLCFVILFSPIVPTLGWGASTGYEEAEQYFEKAVEHNKKRELAEARADLTNAVRLDIEKHKYHQALVLNYVQTRQGPKGLKFYEGLASDHPDSAVVHYWLGRLYLQSRALEDAAREFKISSELNPADDHAFIALGHAYWRIGNDEGAFKAYLEARRLAPNVASVHGGLGNVYYKRKEFKKAQQEYEKAVELGTVMPEARFNLGLIYENNNQIANAMEQWKAIVEGDPNESQARERLARVYFLGEQYEDAAREFSMISRVKPMSDEILVLLGESLIMLASTKEDASQIDQLKRSAIQSFQQAIEIDPSNKKAQDYLDQLSAPNPESR